MAITPGSRGPPALGIQDLPNEMLSKILVHCLPENPLQHRQPDVTIAPMLLCQICTHWRRVALETAELWIQLHHIMRASVALEEDPSRTLELLTDFEFLQWWRGNLRGSSPFLRFGIRFQKHADQRYSMDTDQATFIAQFLSSAQYLELSRNFCFYLGGRPLDQPNFNTFILRDDIGQTRLSPVEESAFNLKIVPFEATHLIRRIHFDILDITKDDLPKLAWSHLTHASLVNIVITIPGWFSLIRECISLQFGRFDLEYFCFAGPPVVEPAFTVLPQLRQLIIHWYSADGDEDLLRNLHLPGLTSLSLQATMTSPQLQAVLSRAPGLKELHLSHYLPCDPDTKYRSVSDSNIETLTARIPLLRRLLLELDWEELKDFEEWLGLLLASKWLQLGNTSIHELELSLGSQTLQTRQQVCDIVKKKTLDGIRLIVTTGDRSLWNQEFAVPAGDVNGYFENSMFKEV